MRISGFGIAIGILCFTAAAMPFAPNSRFADAIYAPADEALPEFLENSTQMVGSLLTTPALADERAPESIDFSRLVKVDDRPAIIHDEGVSTDVIAQNRVRKVGYGYATDVTIVRTPTGTYSTDGLSSAHVLYPGISAKADADKKPAAGALGAIWKTGFGWVNLPIEGTGSIVTYGESADGDRYLVTNDRACVTGKGYLSCS